MSSSPNPTAGPYRKPRLDLYTMLLFVALMALIVGCVFLYLEVMDYGQPPFQGAPAPQAMLDAGRDCGLVQIASSLLAASV